MKNLASSSIGYAQLLRIPETNLSNHFNGLVIESTLIHTKMNEYISFRYQFSRTSVSLYEEVSFYLSYHVTLAQDAL